MTGSEASPQVWLMKHGPNGEYESTALEQGVALLGFQEYPSMEGKTAEQIGEMATALYPDRSVHENAADVSQLRMFACRMQIDDSIVVSLHNQPGQIAIGRIAGAYEFRDIDGEPRHTRRVQWLIESIAKTTVGEHLRQYYTPGER